MAVADALISKAVDMMVSNIQQEFRLVAGVEEEVEKLTSNLQSIRAVLVDAERRQWKEATTVQLWLDRLKHIVYDIDDVVDEWSYEMLRSENAQNPKGKVPFFSRLSVCYCFPRVVLRHHIAVKISDLNARLDVIAVDKDRYGFQLLRSDSEQVERSITTSDIDISEVKGRECDKEKLVNLLLAESSQMPKLRLIALAGMGGIGKTTLARIVYNDKRVKSHFDKKIWVCVSDPFDEFRIAKEILESLQGSTPTLSSLSNILEKIKEFINGKRILVVLDDVWNEDPKKWKQLEDCLRGGSHGIRILVSTRNENVARIMGCLETNIFRIGLLSEEESWELFCMIAFAQKSSEERASLEKMSRVIVKKCKGLPLAIRAIAGLLRFKQRRTEWQIVLDSQLWDLEEVQGDIVGPLWLSYYDLPSSLRQCFAYCAVFPKDYKMEKYELIKLWMAQGYIKGTQSKDVEMIGEEYFENLVMRSFFQDVEVGQEPYGITETVCKVHDIVHDFAQLLAKKECLYMEVENDKVPVSLDDSSFDSLRHLSISFKWSLRAHHSLYSAKKLRSLLISTPLIDHNPSVELDLQKLFNEFSSLRSLKLRYCSLREIHCDINKLIHLRELDLSWNYELEELPDAIWELYNLQILILDRCDSLLSLNGLGRLTNLRHLYYSSEKDFLLPKGMARLSGLRSLNLVCIDVYNVEAFSLKHLKNFNLLSGALEIRWIKRGAEDSEDAKQASLQDKKLITQLQLLFGGAYTRRIEEDEELAEALNAPPNLETITIGRFMGLRPPSWLGSLTGLKAVMLLDCNNFEHLPSLGKLPFLEALTFWRFSGIRKVGAEFLGLNEMETCVAFYPKLTSLTFFVFSNWEQWDDVNGDGEMSIMPSLTCLRVETCRKLKALPNFIVNKTALKLEIISCDALRDNPTVES